MDMAPVFIVGIIFISFVAVIKIVSDNKVRTLLIEKGEINENTRYLYANRSVGNLPASIKWGLVCIGIGLAFLLSILAPNELQGEITVGGIFLLSGLGLLVYYYIGNRLYKKQQK